MQNTRLLPDSISFLSFVPSGSSLIMTKSDTLTERERIKAIIETKIEAVIEWRQQKKRKRFIFVLEKLKRDLLFLIDNPNYKRKIDVPIMRTKTCVKCCQDFDTLSKYVSICDECKK